MIPRQLTLQNFLSYHQAHLDFTGLHTACICGANGAGKSSLLEAITWSIWGKTRTSTEEDVINAGQNNTRVDFQFSYNYQTYKVIRTRKRGGGTTLDFQVENEGKFKSISGKGVRTTQQIITDTLKLDYDTFINSAYLRQGKADEFMNRTASERKEILAELLKLNQYENLATKAKDLAKHYQGNIESSERNLEELENELEKRDELNSQLANLQKQLKELQAIQKKEQKKLQKLQEISTQRQSKEEQLEWQQKQHDILTKKCEQIKAENKAIQIQISQLETILNQRDKINLGYQQLQQLQEKETNLRKKFAAYQEALKERQDLEQQLRLESNDLSLAIQREKTNLDNLEKQGKELATVIQDREKIKTDLEQLDLYRQRLNELDIIQAKVSPLQQRRLNLQVEIDGEKAKLKAELEQLEKQEIELNQDWQKVPQKEQELLALQQQIHNLETKENYLKRVEEKGLAQKSFKERCQESQGNLQKQIQDLQQKLDMLAEERAICPLCERELDEHHLHYVKEKTLQQKKTFEDQSWQYGEKIIHCERELTDLRKEYKKLERELSIYDSLKSKSAKLEEQLDVSEQNCLKLQQLRQQKKLIENKLALGDYAQNLQQELNLLDREINSLNYDEKTHSLVRQEEKRWRKAEFQKAKIDDAQKKYDKIQAEKPQHLQKIADLETQLEQLTKTSPIQAEINQKQLYLDKLNYNDREHNEVRNALQTLEIYQSKYIELQQAEKQFPQGQEKLAKLGEEIALSEQQKMIIHLNLDKLKNELGDSIDYRQEMQILEQECEERRQKIDYLLTTKGGLEQSLTNLDNRQSEYESKYNLLQEVKKKYRIYYELGKAFGKNGIQALMIENILPQLEAEANQILARLTENQLHLQFLTQKPKSGRSKKSVNNLKDTLEIIISDVKGTRSYETYSGGEAFRINFAIRLALARILAQRSGTSLQLLIVDEGFGTQDAEGCDRLVAALNAIASDFACILTVTHMPQFKEAFQHRIEVSKTSLGSQIRLST
jgi:exonuclease SbcC